VGQLAGGQEGEGPPYTLHPTPYTLHLAGGQEGEGGGATSALAWPSLRLLNHWSDAIVNHSPHSIT